MQKLLPFALSALILAGCGAAPATAPVGSAHRTDAQAPVRGSSTQGLLTQLERLAEAILKKYDLDADGEIELGREFNRDYKFYVGGTKGVWTTMREIDTNRNKEVSLAEMKAFYASDRVVRAMHMFEARIFKLFDADNSGGVTLQEFRFAIKNKVDEDPLGVLLPTDFEGGDLDHDGVLTLSEFEDMDLKAYVNLR